MITVIAVDGDMELPAVIVTLKFVLQGIVPLKKRLKARAQLNSSHILSEYYISLHFAINVTTCSMKCLNALKPKII